MLTVAFALFALAPQTAPMPPYRREATVQVFPSSYDPPIAILANRFYAASSAECVAYTLPGMKRLWTKALTGPERPEGLLASGNLLYVSASPSERKGTGHLYALNADTGKVIWSVPSTSTGSPIALGTGCLYLSLKPFTVSAFNLKTRKPLWTNTVGDPKKDSSIFAGRLESVVFDSGCVLANCQKSTFSFDAKTGKQLWVERNSSMYRGTLSVLKGVVLVPTEEGSVGREVRSGKVLWRGPGRGYGDFGGVFEGAFVSTDGGMLAATDPKTGKELWSQQVGPSNASGGSQFGVDLGGMLHARGMSNAVIVDAKGKLLWKGKDDEGLPHPIWANGSSIVCFDGTRLLRYVHGTDAAIPSDPVARRALARKWVEHYDDLDAPGIKRLEGLKDDAFEPLLQAFVKTCDAHDAVGTKGDSYPLYSKYEDLAKVLASVTTSKRTKDLMDALEKAKPKSSAKPTLLSLLARVGDPKIVTPYFLKEIEGVETPGFEMYESNTYVARQYIAQSTDPRAVAYMIKVLKNPKADGTQRFEAYVNLARTGGEEGLKAVLAERNKRKLLPPLEQRVVEGYLDAGEFGRGMKVLGEKKDTQGRTWGLLQCGALGSAGDLWLAEKVDGKWAHPLFTGVSTAGVSEWAKPKPPEPTFAGKTAKQLADGAWFTTLVGNAELSKDTDGDGLTDIEEKRLGTDPNKSDTDGDGDPDGVDPWPNAAPRTLSEAEQVMAVAYEARYHFESSVGPGLFYGIKGQKPFEMPGRDGPMLWVPDGNARWSLPLEQCYEQGVAIIRIQGGSEDESRPVEERAVSWNKDHTEASVTISTYYGGLNGTGYRAVIRKFGNEWVVVAMYMAYVS